MKSISLVFMVILISATYCFGQPSPSSFSFVSDSKIPLLEKPKVNIPKFPISTSDLHEAYSDMAKLAMEQSDIISKYKKGELQREKLNLELYKRILLEEKLNKELALLKKKVNDIKVKDSIMVDLLEKTELQLNSLNSEYKKLEKEWNAAKHENEVLSKEKATLERLIREHLQKNFSALIKVLDGKNTDLTKQKIKRTHSVTVQLDSLSFPKGIFTLKDKKELKATIELSKNNGKTIKEVVKVSLDEKGDYVKISFKAKFEKKDVCNLRGTGVVRIEGLPLYAELRFFPPQKCPRKNNFLSFVRKIFNLKK